MESSANSLESLLVNRKKALYQTGDSFEMYLVVSSATCEQVN